MSMLSLARSPFARVLLLAVVAAVLLLLERELDIMEGE